MRMLSGGLAVILFCLLGAGPLFADSFFERQSLRLRAAEVLRLAYPDFAFGVRQEGGFYSLQVPEEECIPLDYGMERSGRELLEHPSLLDAFSQVYPHGPEGRFPEVDFDPGRARSTELLMALYGRNRQEVEKNLAKVDFLGRRLSFNFRHGAAAALERVGAALQIYLRDHPQDSQWVFPPDGTYVWRNVRGTSRLSAHAFGIALDLNPGRGVYWKSSSPEAQEQARRDYPQGIVDIFEAEGFIWGGKWSHCDFMHFEYRPEILLWSSAGSPTLEGCLDACRLPAFSH